MYRHRISQQYNPDRRRDADPEPSPPVRSPFPGLQGGYADAVRPAALKVLACLALALAGAVALRLWAGGWPDGENASLLFQIRGGRLAAGLIVGAALGCAGAMLQCLLRNPLASPDLLGLASGAGLGVMVAVYAAYLLTGRIAQAGVGGVGAAGAAIAGAIGTLSLVYLLGRRKGVVDPVSLVLVGVVISMLASAGIALVQTLLPDRGAPRQGCCWAPCRRRRARHIALWRGGRAGVRVLRRMEGPRARRDDAR